MDANQMDPAEENQEQEKARGEYHQPVVEQPAGSPSWIYVVASHE